MKMSEGNFKTLSCFGERVREKERMNQAPSSPVICSEQWILALVGQPIGCWGLSEAEGRGFGGLMPCLVSLQLVSGQALSAGSLRASQE